MKKSILRRLYSLLIGLIRAPFFSSKYGIKRGYIHRKKYHHFTADSSSDHCQQEVYETSLQLLSSNNYASIIDVGCGSGHKLIQLFSPDFNCTGIEIGETYQKLIQKYPNKNWLNDSDTDYATLEADVVICSDVIEHVLNPTLLLQKIKSIKNTKLIIISTPDRLLARGWYEYGPPKNTTHVREWNGKEFAKYLKSQGFHIVSHTITNYEDTTQMIVCEKI